MIKDFKRAEGVYVSERTVGTPPYEVRLFKIERVNGDCSVSELEITEEEARDMVAQLARMHVGTPVSDIGGTVEYYQSVGIW
jgi:hypothetical protein